MREGEGRKGVRTLAQCRRSSTSQARHYLYRGCLINPGTDNAKLSAVISGPGARPPVYEFALRGGHQATNVQLLPRLFIHQVRGERAD